MKKPEQLVEGNEVFCSICEDLKLAEKKMEMYKASKYLVLQLRRFKQVGYEKTKNSA
jgi:ubiquitin C-terminal hydrolase